jgi:hypothetical protein
MITAAQMGNICILLKNFINLSMQVQVDIGFDQLVTLVKNLPAKQWAKLKSEIEQDGKESAKTKGLEAFLLKAPTFSKKQLKTISETRNTINQWRTK